MIFEQWNKRNIHSRARKTYIQLIIEEKGKNALIERNEERQRKIRMKEKRKRKSKKLN